MRHEETKRKYQGVFIAAPTPMHDDESLDLPRLGELIRYYRQHGLREGNCVCTILGAGGEAMHLNDAERRQVAETAVEAGEGQIPIFIGVGHCRTRSAVELARYADSIGADGLQLDLPYYFKNTRDDAYAYISEVAQAVECGISLYPTPWTSNLDFDAALLRKICDTLPNVVGLKWAATDLHAWFRVTQEFSDRLSVVSNQPSLGAPSAFLTGARGYVSQGVSAAPQQNVQIVEWLQAGEYELATQWLTIVEDGYYKILAAAIESGYSGEGNYIKASLDAAGFPCGPARLPNRPMPDAICTQFRSWVNEIIGLLPISATA